MARLPKRFFVADAVQVAPALLGTRWYIGGVVATIAEVEAYTADDPASHSFAVRQLATGQCLGRLECCTST